MNGKWLTVLAVTAVIGGAAGAGTARFMAPPNLPATPVAVAATGGAAAAPATGAAAAAAAGGDGTVAAKPGGRGGPTTGTVDRVDGSTLTVRTQSGTVDVPLNEQTTLMRQTSVAPTDLKVGDNVFGRGEDVG